MTFHLTSDPAPRKPFTRRGGIAAQRAGKSLEEMIEFSAGIQKDVVTLEHLPRMGALVVPGGRKVVTRICVDFIGEFNETPEHKAIPFFFDAKNCGKNAVGFDANKWHAETPHQPKFLRRMARAGAVAGILVRSERLGLFLWGGIDHVDTFDTVAFERDGRILNYWRALGPTNGLVDFRKML